VFGMGSRCFDGGGTAIPSLLGFRDRGIIRQDPSLFPLVGFGRIKRFGIEDLAAQQTKIYKTVVTNKPLVCKSGVCCILRSIVY
jgi:hypothetical protein